MRRPLVLVVVGAVVFVALLLFAPAAALAGWRALFIVASAIPIGAVVLLLIARLTGADWDAALVPLTPMLPWLAFGFVPVVIEQAVFVPSPHHLALWLWWPLFAVRGLAALGFWWWIGRRLAVGSLSVLAAGLALLAHGIVITIIATDWMLGTTPAQPDSAIAMTLTTLQIAAATGAACLLGLGPNNARRDLSRLLVAACLGLGYLMFMNYLIIWFGDLPSRVGWYVDRRALPWSSIPMIALVLGIAAPIAGATLERFRIGGASALIALGLVAAWEVSPAGGWLALAALVAGALFVFPLMAGRARA